MVATSGTVRAGLEGFFSAFLSFAASAFFVSSTVSGFFSAMLNEPFL
jgi:broad specificity polyphosphatase/5'/3'-nucleotidase SurE